MTDGVIESASEDGPEHGVDGVIGVVGSSIAESADAIARRIVEAAQAHGSGSAQADDLTVVVIRRLAVDGVAACVATGI